MRLQEDLKRRDGGRTLGKKDPEQEDYIRDLEKRLRETKRDNEKLSSRLQHQQRIPTTPRRYSHVPSRVNSGHTTKKLVPTLSTTKRRGDLLTVLLANPSRSLEREDRSTLYSFLPLTSAKLLSPL